MQSVGPASTHLSDPFQNPDGDEVAGTQVGGNGCEQREDHGSQDAEAKQPLGSDAAGKVAAGNLSQDVAVEKGAQDPALRHRVPVVRAGLLHRKWHH